MTRAYLIVSAVSLATKGSVASVTLQGKVFFFDVFAA